MGIEAKSKILQEQGEIIFQSEKAKESLSEELLKVRGILETIQEEKENLLKALDEKENELQGANSRLEKLEEEKNTILLEAEKNRQEIEIKLSEAALTEQQLLKDLREKETLILEQESNLNGKEQELENLQRVLREAELQTEEEKGRLLEMIETARREIESIRVEKEKSDVNFIETEKNLLLKNQELENLQETLEEQNKIAQADQKKLEEEIDEIRLELGSASREKENLTSALEEKASEVLALQGAMKQTEQQLEEFQRNQKEQAQHTDFLEKELENLRAKLETNNQSLIKLLREKEDLQENLQISKKNEYETREALEISENKGKVLEEERDTLKLSLRTAVEEYETSRTKNALLQDRVNFLKAQVLEREEEITRIQRLYEQQEDSQKVLLQEKEAQDKEIQQLVLGQKELKDEIALKIQQQQDTEEVMQDLRNEIIGLEEERQKRITRIQELEEELNPPLWRRALKPVGYFALGALVVIVASKGGDIKEGVGAMLRGNPRPPSLDGDPYS